MRTLLLPISLFLLTSLATLACSIPTPTPTATPSPTATPTPTPTSPLARALAMKEQLKEAFAKLAQSDSEGALDELIGTSVFAVVEILCGAAAGQFEPDLYLEDLTDSPTLLREIRGLCVAW